ncbi:MAG: chitobiase/beta-hexosaminidase C-terminal domain-containing protein [Treponema sp.]|nr:chitobiase/beta-hexosaminidase C-terminal domain-containing protein [Treponema sp.]
MKKSCCFMKIVSALFALGLGLLLSACSGGTNYVGNTSPMGKSYMIKISDTIVNGSVTASKNESVVGETINIIVAPSDGYVLDSLSVKDSDGNDVSVTELNFTMPKSDVTVSASFKVVIIPILNLSLPKIELSYITEPSSLTTKTKCNEFLDTGFTCNIYRLDELGSGTKVAFSSDDSDVVFYYTLDGSTPTENSLRYETPFEIKRKTTVNVISKKGTLKSEVATLNIDKPYGKSISGKLNQIAVGDGVAGIFVICEALDDLSGPDFSKQHFILRIDDGNAENGDGLASNVIFATFDSWDSNNFASCLGTFNIFGNDLFSSTGTWTGTLWTKNIYELEALPNPRRLEVYYGN